MEQQLWPSSVTDLKMVLVGGLAGCGKTEASIMLASLCNTVHLDKDALTRDTTEQALENAGMDPDDRESEFYLTSVRPREYATLLGEGFKALRGGRSVLLDAPFLLEVTDPNWLETVRDQAAELGAKVSLVWIHADLPAMHERILARLASRDRYKIEHWEEWSAEAAKHPGPLREIIPVFDLYNRGGEEPYLSNQAITIAHALTGSLDPETPVGAVEVKKEKKHRWRH